MWSFVSQNRAEFRRIIILTCSTASREEILRKTPTSLPTFKPDISYLKHGSSKSLASRLARPQLREQEKAKEDEKARAKAKAMEPAMLSPDLLSKITEKRRSERLSREARDLIEKTRPLPKDIIRKIIDKPNPPTAPQLPLVQEIRRAPVQSVMSLPHLTSEQQKTVLDSVARRKAEREARLRRAKILLQKEASEFKENGYQPARMGSKKSRKSDAQREERVFSKELTPIENAEVESDAKGSRPEFIGPPIPSNLLDIFSVPYRPSSKQNYSHYATHTPNTFATPPDALGAVRFAEVTLSHQRSVALPQRKHAMNLISRACAPKSRQVTASQAN
jgi:hypothetical protein